MFQMQAVQKESRSNDRGYTLIEILIAVSILSFGILTVATMQIAAMSANSKAGLSTSQVVSAQDKLEELIALPYDDHRLEAAGNPPGTDTDGNTHQETTSEGYTVRWDVIDNDPISNAKHITVTVTGQGGETRVVSIKSN